MGWLNAQSALFVPVLRPATGISFSSAFKSTVTGPLQKHDKAFRMFLSGVFHKPFTKVTQIVLILLTNPNGQLY